MLRFVIRTARNLYGKFRLVIFVISGIQTLMIRSNNTRQPARQKRHDANDSKSKRRNDTSLQRRSSPLSCLRFMSSTDEQEAKKAYDNHRASLRVKKARIIKGDDDEETKSKKLEAVENELRRLNPKDFVKAYLREKEAPSKYKEELRVLKQKQKRWAKNGKEDNESAALQRQITHLVNHKDEYLIAYASGNMSGFYNNEPPPPTPPPPPTLRTPLPRTPHTMQSDVTPQPVSTAGQGALGALATPGQGALGALATPGQVPIGQVDYCRS
jgi:hypothetical protein